MNFFGTRSSQIFVFGIIAGFAVPLILRHLLVTTGRGATMVTAIRGNEMSSPMQREGRGSSDIPYVVARRVVEDDRQRNQAREKDPRESIGYPRSANAELQGEAEEEAQDIMKVREFAGRADWRQEFSKSATLTPRRSILVAVVTTGSPQIMAIHRTWAKAKARILYFVTEDVQSFSDEIPPDVELLQLEGFSDKQAIMNWEANEYAVLHYLTNHRFLEEFDWFLVVSDKVFVNTAGLQSKLESYRSSGSVYMGRSVSETRKCNHLTGVVYSQGLLSHLKEHLSKCQLKGQSVSECIINGGIHCTQAKETLNLFFLDSKGIVRSRSLFTSKAIAKAVTVYPVRSPEHMYRLYGYFQEVAYNTSREEARTAADNIRNVNIFIPSQLRSPFKPKNETRESGWLVRTLRRLSSPVKLRIGHSRRPMNKFEILNWEYVNLTHVLSLDDEQPSQDLRGEQQDEMYVALNEAVYMVSNWSFVDREVVLENGYHRIDRLRGSEYIFDFSLRGRGSERSNVTKRRVQILRPFQETLVPVSSTIERIPRVNFIVTLSGMSNRLKQFLANFEKNFLSLRKEASLTFVLFQGPDSNEVRSLIDTYVQLYPSSSFSVVDIQGDYSRSVGLDQGTVHFEDNELLFLGDVELEIGTNFLDNCRFNTIADRRVYFPIFFKSYNRHFVDRYYQGSEIRFYSRHNGHWAHDSFEMACIYAGDYRKINSDDQGWRGDSRDLFDRTKSHGYEVFRALEPNIVFPWQGNDCDRKVESLEQSCLRSKAEHLADRMELAQYVFEQEEAQGNVL